MRSNSPSAALPAAHFSLRALIVLNWLSGAAIAVLLAFMPTERWIRIALNLSDPAEIARMTLALHAMATAGLICIPLNYIVLNRLLAIVGTVRAGDPFVAANALRLRSIAWAMVGLQVLGMAIGAIGRSVSTPARPINVDDGFSLAGWLAVLLTFLLARVFAHGALMREDLQGTV